MSGDSTEGLKEAARLWKCWQQLRQAFKLRSPEEEKIRREMKSD